jgi:hypothetical protein
VRDGKKIAAREIRQNRNGFCIKNADGSDKRTPFPGRAACFRT